MKFYYGTTMTELAKGRAFRNPEYFLLADPRATDVIVVGRYDNVINAYEAMGIRVTTIATDDWAALSCRTVPKIEVQVVDYLPIAVPEPQPAERRPSRLVGGPPPIPANWQQMPWADLRRLAASVSDSAVINKNDAFAAIEAVLARMDGEIDD